MLNTHKLLPVLSVAALLAGCVDAEPEITISDARVEISEDGMYDIRWTANGPVNVYRAGAPDAPVETAQRVSENDGDGEHQAPRSDDLTRTYFLLEEANGAVTPVASRLLPLEGGRNFRDLGGYETQDGRRVAWGRLFRSGVMHELTAADYDYLGDLGIAVICDLRSTSERTAEPTDWQAGEVTMLNWDYELDYSTFMSAFEPETMSAERSTQIMASSYGEMLYSHAPYFEEMFNRLAAGEVPLAFHCSAGKDRTGIAAALILSALGVDRATIVHDYSLSDDYVDYMAEMASTDVELDPSDPNYIWTQLPPEVIAPFLASLPVYIESAFARIETDHGDVGTYLREVVQVSDAELEQIRANLLTD